MVLWRKIADIGEFMYSCGLEILHLGGLERAGKMVGMWGVGEGKHVLDVGVRRGGHSLLSS